jgi:hypothetical protein
MDRYPKTNMTRDLGVQLGEKLTLDREPTEVDVTDGATIYKRWTNGTAAEIVVRVKLTGTVWATSKSVGLWTDRATLTYEPIIMGG